MITIDIGSHMTVSNLPGFLKEEFISKNRFRNPKFDTLERLGKWTGNTPEIISLADELPDGSVRLPCGCFPSVIKALKDNGLRFKVENSTVCPTVSYDNPGGTLYP
jgi:hypothetical protein